MKKLIKMLCVFVVAVVAAMPLTAGAGVVSQNYQVRGSWANGNAWINNECGNTYAYVAGGDQVTHLKGDKPVESGYTYAWVQGYNWCTGEWFYGAGSTDTSQTIDRLDSATLSVPVNLYTQSCTLDADTGWWSCNYDFVGTATLTANLTGTGEVSSGISMNQWSMGSYRSFSRFNGQYRQADTAMSLILNGTDMLAGSMGWGNLNKVNSGSHWFYQY